MLLSFHLHLQHLLLSLLLLMLLLLLLMLQQSCLSSILTADAWPLLLLLLLQWLFLDGLLLELDQLLQPIA